VCAPGCPRALYASGLNATRCSCSIWAPARSQKWCRGFGTAPDSTRVSAGRRPSADSAPDGSHWRELYRAALLELDLEKLAERVDAAEEAIRARASFNGGVLSDERIAIQDAMSALNVLKASVKRNNPPFKGSGL
jgi:hypothetical protein